MTEEEEVEAVEGAAEAAGAVTDDVAEAVETTAFIGEAVEATPLVFEVSVPVESPWALERKMKI